MLPSSDNQQYTLDFKEISEWPKLSWVAAINRGNPVITLFHGSCVEIATSWCAEAVWDGDFAEGDFDCTDIVVGTGIRVRREGVFFVTSGDTLNRLYCHQDSDRKIVSNSLPALLAVAEIDLLEDFPYADSMATVMKGLHSYDRQIPSSIGDIQIVYYHNLRLNDDELIEVPKPSSAPDFTDFKSYRHYLFESAKKVGLNAAAHGRKHIVNSLTTVSSGYDSCAAAVVAREAGVTKAVTLSKSRRDASNLFNLNDSGAKVAEQLGMQCTSYIRKRKNFPHEYTAWAAMGNVGDINLAIFDYPQPLCLMFTGFMGDVFWDKDTIQPEPLHRKDTSGARFSETRLELGVFICSPVLWGCRNEAQILKLAHLPEMRPWLLDNAYDRPIPRRLLEEAGIKRGAFGTKKRAATFNRQYGRPLSVDLHAEFSQFLAERGINAGSVFAEKLVLLLSGFDWVFLRRLPANLRFSCKNWVKLPSPTLFFLWANRRLKNRYQQALAKARSI